MSSKVLMMVIAGAAALQLSACASVVKGSTASLGVTTPPVSGATCNLSSPQGNWQLTTPGTVTVDRSKHDIQIHCTKEGYQDAAAVIPSNFEGWTVGNLLIGGIIGVGIDAATGAMHDYPSAFQVPMTKLADIPPVMAPVPDETADKKAKAVPTS